MTVPHRDDPPGRPARRPDHDNQTISQAPHGDEAIFTIVPALIGHRGMPAGENVTSLPKVDASFFQDAKALRRIEPDPH